MGSCAAQEALRARNTANANWELSVLQSSAAEEENQLRLALAESRALAHALERVEAQP